MPRLLSAHEVHRADPVHRRRSLARLAAIAVLCAVGLWLLRDGLLAVQAQAAAGPPEQARRALRGALAGLAALPVLPLWLWGDGLRRLGRAALAEQRFPPREWKTWRDVRVLRDRAAATWARRSLRMAGWARALAGLCAAAALLVWLGLR